jgi:hypothetical protein
MVRRQGSQSPVSCESPVGIFDAHMSFEQATEFEGSEVNIPDPIVDVLEADTCSAANV